MCVLWALNLRDVSHCFCGQNRIFYWTTQESNVLGFWFEYVNECSMFAGNIYAIYTPILSKERIGIGSTYFLSDSKLKMIHTNFTFLLLCWSMERWIKMSSVSCYLPRRKEEITSLTRTSISHTLEGYVIRHIYELSVVPHRRLITWNSTPIRPLYVLGISDCWV